MLAAMAQATRRIRIGCQVTGMIYRHPAVLANMAATVDIISGGRLDLGLGAGWNQQECDAYGIPLPPLKERFDRFDEGVEAIVLLLSQEHSNLDGKYVQLANARCEPKPVQRPHPPIVDRRQRPDPHVAHRRPVRAAVELDRGHRALARDQRRRSTKRCAEIGRDPATIERSVNLRFDPAAGASAHRRPGRRVRGRRAPTSGSSYLPVPHTPDVLEPIADALRTVAGTA